MYNYIIIIYFIYNIYTLNLDGNSFGSCIEPDFLKAIHAQLHPLTEQRAQHQFLPEQKAIHVHSFNSSLNKRLYMFTATVQEIRVCLKFKVSSVVQKCVSVWDRVSITVT